MIRLPSLICLLYFFSACGQRSENTFLIGRTSGALAALKYGLGEDRLGGAKMTYLDTNIVLKVVDSTKDNYKVQLSKNHFAYLEKTSFKVDDTTKIQPYYLSSNWDVNGDDKYDYIK